MLPLETYGEYILVDELGRGGMAVVYEAIDTRTDETVAIKLLYEMWMTDNQVLQRFEREAQVVQELHHPNIIPVLDFGMHDGRMYLTMPFMHGGSLADMFAVPRSISLKATAHLLKQVALALDFAHETGIVHRDIKLENILLDENKKPYLADFGIAHLTDGTRITATGMVTGTPLYMSPEQAMGLEIDYRSDVYGLAVMAYLMTTGYHPFTGNDALAIVNKHISAVAPLPTSVNPELPQSINRVIMRGLAKDPEHRYQSASAFAEAFIQAIEPEDFKTKTQVDIRALNPQNQIMPSNDSASRKIQSPQPTDNPTSDNMRRRPGMIVAFVVLLLLLMAGGMVLSQNGDGDSVVARVAIDETAVRQQLIAELTLTAQSEILAETQYAQMSTTPRSRATLPPTWTPTPTYTITPTPTLTDTGTPAPTIAITLQTIIADAIVNSSNGAPMHEGAGKEFELFGTLSRYTTLTLIGRNANALWLHARTEEGFTGWVQTVGLDLYIDILQLPITWTGSVPQATPTLSNQTIIIIPEATLPSSDASGSSSGSSNNNNNNGGGGNNNPSATPLPTIPPAVTDSDVGLFVVGTTLSKSTLYTGASVSCEEVATVPAGITLTLTRRNEDSSWVYGRHNNGRRGWIETDNLDIKGDVDKLPIVPKADC